MMSRMFEEEFRKMKAKELLRVYLENAQAGAHDLSKYYAENAILVDFQGNIYDGIKSIQEFYKKPMPPGFSLIIENIIEESKEVARATVSVSADVFPSFRMIERLELDENGEILKFEMSLL